MARLFAILFAFLCVSCSSVKYHEFYVAAIDTNEREIVCAIFHDDKPLLDAQNEVILTPAWVKIPFSGRSKEEKLGVRAVEIVGNGGQKMIKGLGEGDVSPYYEDFRFVILGDAKQQLFILRRNKSAGG